MTRNAVYLVRCPFPDKFNKAEYDVESGRVSGEFDEESSKNLGPVANRRRGSRVWYGADQNRPKPGTEGTVSLWSARASRVQIPLPAPVSLNISSRPFAHTKHYNAERVPNCCDSKLNVSDVRSLYEYITHSREKFLSSFRELGWEEFTKNREASWQSMRGIFVHILEVEDSWLHYDVAGVPWPFGDRDPSAFKSFDEVEAYEREVGEKTRGLVENLMPETLASEVLFEWRHGKVKSSIENIFIHSFVDELAHLGELVSLMWQLDVKPPWTDWMEKHHQPI